MKIKDNAHLTYCTNIHSGESWKEVFASLQKYTLPVKAKISPSAPFGIGLRLSNESALTLQEEGTMAAFKQWLQENDLYVFTMNGFPYGNFHGKAVKAQVHAPDWLSRERVDYTILLFNLLAELLPEGVTGGISTSPLSYKYWHEGEAESEAAKRKSCAQLMEVVVHLVQLQRISGKQMHLDIEPEPDGLLENSADYIDFYESYLLKEGLAILMEKLNCTALAAENYIREHLQLCYDVCHFSVEFESAEAVIRGMEEKGLKIGKMQISAALKCSVFSRDSRAEMVRQLAQFNEPVYLHQAVLKKQTGELLKFQDLKPGIEAMKNGDFAELRTHFHVPIFLSYYQGLSSTQDDILEAMNLWTEKPFTGHLEVETYTWDVLPAQLMMDLKQAIQRELSWVLALIESKAEKAKGNLIKAVTDEAGRSY
ncbi:metabolite traffic protein EboE [Pedobacter gandavensis]|uniref:metabolite traffic protein EboE n=1 Tax=Pedobacter gandavensis TaxID=2679963 RepID=UPI00247A8C7D|nr:metabolite traffic protein EboE [Pedobacter gandavensis]WGQ11327.1 metabolite traffic protein EboE [Pedobacter gandavensis]